MTPSALHEAMHALLREVTGYAERGSDEWCAGQFWLGWAAMLSYDRAGSLSHFTAVRDAAGPVPSRALADALAAAACDYLRLRRPAAPHRSR